MRTFGALHTIDSEIDKTPATKRRKSKAAQRPRSTPKTMSMEQLVQFDQVKRREKRQQYKARKDRLALPESE
jgi:hypothetical protein